MKGGMDMPRGDRTGPQGMGPRTGRGMGYCSGFEAPGFMNSVSGAVGRFFSGGLGLARGRGRAIPGYGMGMAWGRGGGRGRGYSSFPSYPEATPPTLLSAEEERTFIEGTITVLKSRLEEMENRLSELSENKK
jgi:hypothetical protein